MTDEEKKELHAREFTKMSTSIMKCYQENIHNFLNTQELGTITDADVIIMVMNLTIGISTNIYYSLKQILPTTTIDYDFAKVKIINELSDHFEQIKQFKPENEMHALTVDQVKEILDVGHMTITFADGTVKKVMKEDLLVRKEEVEKLIEGNRKEILAPNPPKIILPPKRNH